MIIFVIIFGVLLGGFVVGCILDFIGWRFVIVFVNVVFIGGFIC